MLSALALLLLVLHSSCAQVQQRLVSESELVDPPRRTLCVPPSTAPAQLEAVIEQCQEEIKQAVLEEALEVLGDAGQELDVNPQNHNRTRRETFTGEERRIAGCLLQCVYRKVKAVDEAGLPTIPGMVRLYSDGVSDRNYFQATVQAVHQCMSAAERRRALNPSSVQDGGYTCDLAYDMFTCVSDRIEAICGQAP